MSLNDLAFFTGFMTIFTYCVIGLTRFYRDRQWRDYLHTDAGWIAPDGRDFSGRPVRRKAE